MFFWNCRWDAASQAIFGVREPGFNPCFSGIAVGTNYSPCFSVYFFMFQSLFCWNCRWDQGDLHTFPLDNGGFQSLFCWNCRWDNTPLKTISIDNRVSILVLLELPLGHITEQAHKNRCDGFNPCFAGIAVGTEQRATIPVALFCFNPCFAGIAVGTLGPLGR